jgi:hypothetical protein
MKYSFTIAWAMLLIILSGCSSFTSISKLEQNTKFSANSSCYVLDYEVPKDAYFLLPPNIYVNEDNFDDNYYLIAAFGFDFGNRADRNSWEFTVSVDDVLVDKEGVDFTSINDFESFIRSSVSLVGEIEYFDNKELSYIKVYYPELRLIRYAIPISKNRYFNFGGSYDNSMIETKDSYDVLLENFMNTVSMKNNCWN